MHRSPWLLGLTRNDGYDWIGRVDVMKKINLESIPWVKWRSPKGRFQKFRRDIAAALQLPNYYPDSGKWGASFLDHVFRMQPEDNYFGGEE